MVEFVGDFDFLRGREGAKRVAMMLIWKRFFILLIFNFIVRGGILRADYVLKAVVGFSHHN